MAIEGVRRVKVVQVVPHVGYESSGPSYSVPGLCRGLVVSSVDVELHFLDLGQGIPPHLGGAQYRIHTYPQRDRINLGWSPGMQRGLCSACQTADIIHDNSLWMMPNVYPAWAVKGTRCKLVVAPRGTLAAWSLQKGWLKKKIFGWLLQNRVLRRADMFHATSEKEYEEIRALGYKQPVAIVPIGMEIPEVREGGESGEKGERGMRRVVFFGRLHKVKAVDRLVQAWEIVNRGNGESGEKGEKDWELVIAGPDNGIRGELEQYIAEHKIPRVRFVGEINGQAKYEFLSNADLYVLPSHTENFGVTVAEALACGTPVIVSKGTPWQGVRGERGEKEVVVGSGSGTRSTADSNTQTLKHSNNFSRCGWWVENDPETLAKTLREAMSLSDEERRRMGEAGRDWIRRDFSWKGIGAKMKAAYEWLLDPVKNERPEWVRVG